GGARVVAEQEVGDLVAGDGETGAETEVPGEVGGEIPLQPPPAVVGADVERVVALDPGGGVADVPHGLGARGVGVHRAPGAGVVLEADVRAVPLVVGDVLEDSGVGRGLDGG